MNCGGRIYKGQDIEISVPFTTSGFTDFLAEYFTDGEKKIQRTIERVRIEDGILTAYFQDTDLDLLNDGVVRYMIRYKIDGFDCVQCTNTPFYLKTPADYNAVTPEDIYDEGYDAGYGPLYTRDYAENVAYEDVREYFENLAEVNIGACSALYRNGKVLRSYDWFYNYQVPFLVSTPNGVMGVACGLSGATAQTMEEGLSEEVEKLIPWYLVDGINKHGLCAEVNVVPSMGNTGTHPADPSDRICSLALVRYILDNYTSVEDACSGLADLEVFFPKALLDMGYECHWMLADREKSIVLEIIDGQFVAVTSDKSTNFHLEGVEFNMDGSVYTNVDAADGNFPSSMGIEAYGAGLERWNILNSAEDMDDFEVLDALKYSQSYTKDMDINFWYSEFVGTDITVDTPYTDAAFAERIDRYKAKWDERKRDENTVWISTHQVVYDLNNLSMEVRTQEKNGVYRKIRLDVGGGPDFSVIGYDDEDNAAANTRIAADLAYSKTLYDAWDPSYTSAYGLYANNKQLVYVPNTNTRNITNMNSMFMGCTSLTTVPKLSTSNVTKMNGMFTECSSLTTVPKLSTSNVTNMGGMFRNCTLLTSLPELDCSSCTDMSYFFGYYTITTLTDLGGFLNLKCNWNDGQGLNKCPNLTVQSLLNVLNGLYDFTGHGETPTSSQGNLQLGQANYDKLTAEQIAIGTNKGWTITA